jgi:hypothetical protein
VKERSKARISVRSAKFYADPAVRDRAGHLPKLRQFGTIACDGGAAPALQVSARQSIATIDGTPVPRHERCSLDR